MSDKRKQDRRDFSYYMQVKNFKTKEIIGYVADIGTGGFKLDCPNQIAPGQDFQMQIALTPEISTNSELIFYARSKWCQPDHIDPTSFNVGFEIVSIAPSDMDIFIRIFEKYGSSNTTRKKGSDTYLWGR